MDRQEIVYLCAEKREDWPKVAEFLKKGALMFVYGRRMGIICIAAGQKVAEESLIRGRISGLPSNAVPNPTEFKQHKGLAKILSLMLPLELAREWIANPEFFDDWTDADIAGKMMWRCPLRPASKIPQVIMEGRKGTNEIQFSAMGGTMGELSNWLIREHGVFITGTSANYAGRPTIIDRDVFDLFAAEFKTDQPKVILEGGLIPNQNRGIDSLSIFWPRQQLSPRRSAFVIRAAVDFLGTAEMMNKKGVRVIFDQFGSKFPYTLTLTERARMVNRIK